ILAIKVNTREQNHIKLSTVLQPIKVNFNPNISGEENIVAGKLLVKKHQLLKIMKSILQSMTHLNIKHDEKA
ncbi:hypothetical protein KIN20_014340, partial [Parelaphostrongylus tenuis]